MLCMRAFYLAARPFRLRGERRNVMTKKQTFKSRPDCFISVRHSMIPRTNFQFGEQTPDSDLTAVAVGMGLFALLQLRKKY